jgi:diguanylate cyclase (GGDEF)-like protein
MRFADPLEDEFRRGQADRTPSIVRLPLWLALLLVGVLSMLDGRALPAELALQTNVIRLGLVAPLLALSLLATYPGHLIRFAARLRNITAGVWAAATVVLVWLTQDLGPGGGVLWEALAVTLYLYLLLGLGLAPALLSASAILFAVFLFRTGDSTPATAYGPVLLTFANIIGAVASFRMERVSRAVFLEREVISLVVGTDSDTGIPNRQVFDTHLRSIWRQAQRESKSAAVMLVEIDFFEAFTRRYGQLVADNALRRVAHAVMSCARRPLDRAARFDDSRIALALFDPEAEFIETVAGRVRSEVALLDIPNEEPEAKGSLTVSVAIAYLQAHPGRSEDSLLDEVTEALSSGAPERARVAVRAEDVSETAILRGPWSRAQPS